MSKDGRLSGERLKEMLRGCEWDDPAAILETLAKLEESEACQHPYHSSLEGAAARIIEALLRHIDSISKDVSQGDSISFGRATEWQPISSAPKEPEDKFIGLGPRIILGFARDEENCSLPSCEGYWRPYLAPGANGRGYLAGWVSTLDPHVPKPYIRPTHWMTLPEAPK